jgi:hypothetical protein
MEPYLHSININWKKTIYILKVGKQIVVHIPSPVEGQTDTQLNAEIFVKIHMLEDKSVVVFNSTRRHEG